VDAFDFAVLRVFRFSSTSFRDSKALAPPFPPGQAGSAMLRRQFYGGVPSNYFDFRGENRYFV